MTQLNADTARSFELGDFNDLPVKAASAIYQGSAIGLTSGYARQLTAGDQFGGFAEEGVASQTSDGAAYVKVRARGRIRLTISSVAATDIGMNVYASDGDTFTLTESTNTYVGRIARYVTTDTALVIFDATSAGDPHLVDWAALADGPSYDDDAAAEAGGVGLKRPYRNGNFIMVRIT
jgi:hypothetical protein